MTTAAIREELIRHGFSHVIDNKSEADYIIISKITVNKAQEINLPSWNNISDDNMKTVETGLSRAVATLDCKIKRADTDEIIGEFHTTGGSIDTSSNDTQSPAVMRMAATAAQEVRKIFNREAANAFSSVKIIVQTDSNKVSQLENILRKTQGVNNVYMRGYNGGRCTIDVETDLAPQQLYSAMTAAAKNSLKLQMKSFSSTTLEVLIN